MSNCKYLVENEDNEDFDEMEECTRHLDVQDMKILFDFKSGECIEFFEQLKKEVGDLEICSYFEKYYSQLRNLISCMQRDYPSVDMSSNDIDILYERLHMRDKN